MAKSPLSNWFICLDSLDACPSLLMSLITAVALSLRNTRSNPQPQFLRARLGRHFEKTPELLVFKEEGTLCETLLSQCSVQSSLQAVCDTVTLVLAFFCSLSHHMEDLSMLHVLFLSVGISPGRSPPCPYCNSQSESTSSVHRLCYGALFPTSLMLQVLFTINYLQIYFTGQSSQMLLLSPQVTANATHH